MKYELILASAILFGCGEKTGADGKINIKMEANSAFKSASTDPDAITVTYGCVVLTSEKTACIYYYNGKEQVDGQISDTALSRGPGSSGYTFVAAGTTVSAQEGGTRNYTFYNGIFKNGSAVNTPTNQSGQLDLYANSGSEGSDGEDITWLVTFGSAGDPTTNRI